MTKFVYVVCVGTATARNAVRGLVDASFRTDAIRVETRLGGTVTRAPVVQQRSTVRGASICAALGAVVGCTAAIIVTAEAGAAQGAAWIAALRWMLGGAAAGAFVGAVGGFVNWRTGPQLPPEIDDEALIVVGVETQAERIDEARRALQQATQTTPAATDGPPERVAADVLRAHA